MPDKNFALTSALYNPLTLIIFDWSYSEFSMKIWYESLPFLMMLVSMNLEASLIEMATISSDLILTK
jgi:hypothetical protein